MFATISGAIIGGVAGAIGAYLNGDNILAGALTGAVNGGACGFVAEATALTGGIALAFCAGIGMACETANQVANGKTLRTMDHGSVVLRGAFSAMSYGLCKGVESLMGDASEAVKNFVTTIRGASTALVGVAASNIHNDNQKRKEAAILDCWSRRENHYRRWATR